VTRVARVLLVGKGPPDRGGIAAYLDGLLTGPSVGSHSVELLNLTRDEIPRSGRVTTANIRRTFADARLVWRAAPTADLIHIHTALVPLVTLIRAGLLALMARVRGVPVIVHAHSGKVQRWLTTPARRRLARVALAPATRVVAVSEGGRAVLAQALGDSRVVLVDNGVDIDDSVDAAVDTDVDTALDPAPAPHDGAPRVLFAGVLTERKGLLDLFAASTVLAARGVDHEVWVAGGTPDEGADAEHTVRAAAPPSVRFLGAQPHAAMAGLYRSVDVFCLPSWWEAMPMSILEAAAARLPVVATHVGDIARAVIDGTTGFVVPTRDHAALASALEQLLRDGDLRRTFGLAGHEHVRRNFAASTMREALAALYDAHARVPRKAGAS